MQIDSKFYFSPATCKVVLNDSECDATMDDAILSGLSKNVKSILKIASNKFQALTESGDSLLTLIGKWLY